MRGSLFHGRRGFGAAGHQLRSHALYVPKQPREHDHYQIGHQQQYTAGITVGKTAGADFIEAVFSGNFWQKRIVKNYTAGPTHGGEYKQS